VVPGAASDMVAIFTIPIRSSGAGLLSNFCLRLQSYVLVFISRLAFLPPCGPNTNQELQTIREMNECRLKADFLFELRGVCEDYRSICWKHSPAMLRS
jgi:hypothetical protein